MTEKDDFIRFKNEPLTREALNILVEDNAFLSGLSEMANRAVLTAAEGGLIVYKKVGFAKLVIVKAYGLSDIRDNIDLLGAQDLAGAHVFLSDPDESKRRRIGLNLNSYIRMGNLHLHPTNYEARFSGPDFQNYERLAFGRNHDLHIVCSSKMFDIVGCVNRKKSQLNLFGFSLPKGGNISNEYQRLGDDDTMEVQQECLVKCGFRVASLDVPVDIKHIKLQGGDLKGLLALGV